MHTRNRFKVCVIIVILFFMMSATDAQIRIRETNRAYQQGDWITFATTRFVRYVSIGHTYVYFSTTGGITRLNRFSYKWDFPWTTSNGLPDNDIFLLIVAQQYQQHPSANSHSIRR